MGAIVYVAPRLVTIKLYNNMTDWINLLNAAIKYIDTYNPMTDYAHLSLYGVQTDIMFSSNPVTLVNEYGNQKYDAGVMLYVDSTHQYGFEQLDREAIEFYAQANTNHYVASAKPVHSDGHIITAIAPMVTSDMSVMTQFPIQQAV